jgi:hypothetical protein
MPILSRTRGYLFLMAGGTGCTAVGDGVLVPSLDGEYFPAASIFDQQGNLRLNNKHAKLPELKQQGLLTDEEADGFFKFTTVRNPFDRLVTDYVRLRTVSKDALEELPTNRDEVIRRHPELRSQSYLRKMDLALQYPFGDWLERRLRVRGTKGRLRRPFGSPYPKPRSHFKGYIEEADFVMRFERLQEDFNEVLRRIGVDEPIEIPKINVTKARDRDYREYYTPKARAVVERVYAPDIKRFGYSF